MIFAITHRRRAKSLRLQPGGAQRASRGAGILPSFVSSGRSAPPQLADVHPALARLPSPLPSSPPPPLLRPPLGAGTHSAPMMSSGGNLPCSKTRIIQRSRGERGAGGGGSRAFRRTHNLPAQYNWSPGQDEEGSAKRWLRAGWAWWG